MKKIYNNKVLMTFFLIQPIIDILTSLLAFPISIGIIVRSLFLIYASIYIIKNANKNTWIYLIISGIYLITNIIGHIILIDNLNIVNHITSLVHLIYFPVILLFFYKYFKKEKLIDNKIFIYSSLIIGLSLILSFITKTNLCSYHMCVQHGTTGWFSSANEYGIIMLFLLSISMNEILEHKNISYISYIISIIFLILLGTKTSYFGLIFLHLGYIIFFIISIIIKKKIKFNYIFLLSLITVILVFPFTNLYYNMHLRAGDGVEDILIEKRELEPDLTDDELIKKYQDEIDENKKRTVAFNGRDDFLKCNKEIYKNTNLFNKLFGITKTEYKCEGVPWSHETEMDLHDILFYHGLFALILDLLIPAYLIYNILKNIFKNIKSIFKNNIILSGLLISLMILVSILAGHILLQPAVSIYFAYSLIYLYRKVVK